jgi:hypothetical protein
MDCLGLMESGNYAYHLCRIFERRGKSFEVVPVPCKIARGGCSYCLKFPIEFVNEVKAAGNASGMPIKEIYKMIPSLMKVDYVKL